MIIYLVCQLVLNITAGAFASSLLFDLIPLKELAQFEVPVVVLHQLPGFLTLRDGGVSPLVPGQSAAHHPAQAIPDTRSEAVARRGVTGGI